ncbi:uncharacterized protein LOC144113044 [Amblyomma americanum]
MFDDHNKGENERGSTFICEIGMLHDLVSGAACSACGRCDLSIRESAATRKGLAAFLELYCQNDACPTAVLSSTYSSSRISRSCKGSDEASARGSARDAFAVNVKSVVAARAIGLRHEQLLRFCAIMGFAKPVHRRAFVAVGKKLHAAATKAAAENLEQARQLTAAEAGSTNVAVMFDGTWQKRGHKSHNGVGTAISLLTGLCLDFEVLSNYCLSCSRHKALEDEEEQIWQASHTPVREKNATCSAHAMETEAALRIWKRTDLYATPLKYTTFLSDGDSKAYAAVAELDIYGSVPVQKEDCTNHVAKRLGIALRKAKLPRGEKLKDKTIAKLQGYFQVATTSNKGNVRDMYCAVWASYFHSCSRDGASSHKFCPDGEMSWCKHKRALALGQPAPVHTPILSVSQGKAVLPIYERLTDEKLLQRCVKGQTQNAAESLNSKIWLLCPKTKFVTRTVVDTATAIAVLWFNKGHARFEEVLQELGILPSKTLLSLSKEVDKRRISSMSTKATAEARAHCHNVTKKARLEESARRDCEGPTYGAGGF